MKWKRTDGDSAKAVREQVFLSRGKSEPGIVETSVSKSSTYYQYCHSDFSVAQGSKNEIDKKKSTAPGLTKKIFFFFLNSKCTVIWV